MSAIELFAAVGTVPALPGARCRGKAVLFDGDGPDGAQTRQAAWPCSRCPALARCREWVESQEDQRHLHGVIGGKLYTWASHDSLRKWPQALEIQEVCRFQIEEPPSRFEIDKAQVVPVAPEPATGVGGGR